jgi:hypothetical protein
VSDKVEFPHREKRLEDDYFRRKEQELIEKMRQRASDEAQKKRLGDKTGVTDEVVLKDLQELGYTADTVMLLHLVPLIQVAWAEGDVSAKERELIVGAARSLGIDAGSAADRQLDLLLEERPPAIFFESTLRAIRAILEARAPEDRAKTERDLLSLSDAIASASGGFAGFRKVSDQERQIIAHIREVLDKDRKP